MEQLLGWSILQVLPLKVRWLAINLVHCSAYGLQSMPCMLHVVWCCRPLGSQHDIYQKRAAVQHLETPMLLLSVKFTW